MMPTAESDALRASAATKACRELLLLAANATSSVENRLAFGRIRGTGPGVSFGSAIQAMETAHPLALQSPFEGSERVSGAVWDPKEILSDTTVGAAIAKLRWAPHANDLPMHIHDHSDRFIVVLKGRGFFHWSDSEFDMFDGSDVQTIAARERDVFVFKRGLVHTFSTADHPMTLISVQSPYISFEDPHQYRLPSYRWHAAEQPRSCGIVCRLSPAGSELSIPMR